MTNIYVYICLCVLIAKATINCIDDDCTVDPIKNNLLSWYDAWIKGFEVDYITTTELRQSYDFIVVGAGIGGSVVAHRLAMDPSYPKVLLLEAGGKHNTSGLSNQMIPVKAGENQLSDIDWKYKSEPSNGYCCEWNKDTRVAIPRGKVTGGSGILNTNIWVRGHKEDWDILFNITNWKWNDVLPYFKKVESLRTSYKNINKYRGYNGPIIINSERDLRDQNAIFHENVLKAFLDTKQFKFLENGQNSDSGSNIGVAFSEYNIDDNGQRHDAFIGYNKYLRTQYKNEYENGVINLDILPNAYVTKVLFDDASESNDLIRAKGVEFADLTDNKKIYSVYLTQNDNSEIMLGGGSINTPQLLMLSGLGPKDELNKHKIKIIKDIGGIGNNLHHHIMSYMRYHWKEEYFSEVLTVNKIQNTLNNFTLFKEYLFKGKGILSTVAPHMNSFIRTNVMNKKYGTNENYPDLQMYIIAGWHGIDAFINRKDNVEIDYECGDVEYYDDRGSMMNIMTIVNLQHPESIGWVKLKSKNPFDYPAIQPNYLKSQFDIDSLIEGHKIMNNIMQQPSIKQLWDTKMECKKYGDLVNNDANLEKYIRDSMNNGYHPIGTCKMGDVSDELAVVDNDLLVRYTKNLRIVDASILPQQTSGNTQAPVFMVAEKASDIILKKFHSK
eukprot:323187_1